MNYGELKTNIKALAFEEDETITEYEENDVIPTAINRAISILAEKVPIVKRYTITQDGTDEDIQEYDFTRVVKDFLSFEKLHPVRIDDGNVYKPFGEYEIENDEVLIIPGNASGTFRVFYRASHTPYVSGGSMDDVEIPLKKKVHHLVPLLAAYYVWLDDDATKAAQYYNMYETEEGIALSAENNPSMVILGGGL